MNKQQDKSILVLSVFMVMLGIIGMSCGFYLILNKHDYSALRLLMTSWNVFSTLIFSIIFAEEMGKR